MSTVEALEEAVQKYKMLARQVEPHSDQAKDIIRRLVQLRMKLFEAKVQRREFPSRPEFHVRHKSNNLLYCDFL